MSYSAAHVPLTSNGSLWLMACMHCGALVLDRNTHDSWHQQLDVQAGVREQ